MKDPGRAFAGRTGWVFANRVTTYVVIGAGAIGGFYGAHLAKAGQDVHFLFRKDADYVREHGLNVISPDGNFSLPEVNAYPSWDSLPQADVVIVAVKSQANEEVAQRIPQVLKPDGAVLLIQNGINGEPIYAEQLQDSQEVIGGLAFIGSQRTAPNEISHFSFGTLTLAGYSNDYRPVAPTAKMQQIQEDFAPSGVPIVLADNLLGSRWQKLLWNIPFNALSVILRARTDTLVNDPAIVDLVRELMQEVSDAADAERCPLPDGLIDAMIDGTKFMPAYATSMKVDFDHGRGLELDSIVGQPIVRARNAGAPMLATEVIYRQLQYINNQLLAQ